ncbi:MAG: putative transposase [Saprospiraceae bacterium]|jgi:putative transposase
MKKPLKSKTYRRNLPHIIPEDAVLCMTVRLHGSLPKEIIYKLKEERAINITEIASLNLTPKETKIRLRKIHALYFSKFDDLLDDFSNDSNWLKNPAVAQTIVSALLHFNNERYKLVCYTIMSNHIHFVFYNLDRELSKIMHSFKLFSAREANIIIKRTGESFWADESYDHYVRSRREFKEQVRYVLNNPVKAGLVEKWTDWRFSYLRKGFEWIWE